MERFLIWKIFNVVIFRHRQIIHVEKFLYEVKDFTWLNFSRDKIYTWTNNSRQTWRSENFSHGKMYRTPISSNGKILIWKYFWCGKYIHVAKVTPGKIFARCKIFHVRQFIVWPNIFVEKNFSYDQIFAWFFQVAKFIFHFAKFTHGKF